MSTDLIQQLQAIDAIKYGDFTLKSGLKSSIYVDLRPIVSYPKILQKIADLMWEKIADLKPELICGVPYTALPIATAISLKHQIPMVMRRKEAKNYGTKKMIEGVFKANEPCVIIEDVITTASSVIETIDVLDTVNLKVKDIVVLVDREQGGYDNLANKGYRVHPVFTLSELKAAQPK